MMFRGTAFPFEVYDRYDEVFEPGQGIDFNYIGSWILSNGYVVGSIFNVLNEPERLEAVFNGADPSTLDGVFTFGKVEAT